MARPTPKDNARRPLFGWLTDKDVEKWASATEANLPAEVRALCAYRHAETAEEQVNILAQISNIPWDLLSDAAKSPEVWQEIARKMGPQALLMNLNTLLRHEVIVEKKVTDLGAALVAAGFSVKETETDMIDYIADRIANEDEIKRSKQFPYEFFTAYMNADVNIPHKIRAALQQAAEIACGNVPELPGPVVIGLDTSGSMGMAITGNRGPGATSRMTCVDVAALFAAAILRRNPDSVVIPFDTTAYNAKIDPSDSILSIAARMAQYGGGGTHCALPIIAANTKYKDRKFAGMVLVSDNESWIGTGRYGSTGVMTAWDTFVSNQRRLAGKSANPKLVCIDLQPYDTVQACERTEIINIGGFSDSVFQVVSAFIADKKHRFVAEVESMSL